MDRAAEEIERLMDADQSAAVVTYIDNLEDALRCSPRLVVERVRAYARRGKFLEVCQAADQADFALGTHGEGLLLRLEKLGLNLFVPHDDKCLDEVDVAEAATQMLKDAFTNDPSTTTTTTTAVAADDPPIALHSVEFENASVTCCRLQLARYQLGDKTAQLRTILDRLLTAAALLESHGRFARAIWARLMVARERLPFESRVEDLRQCAHQASNLGYFGLAGDALIDATNAMLETSASLDSILAQANAAQASYELVDGGHALGAIAADFARAKARIRKANGCPGLLAPIYDRFQQADHPLGLVNVVSELCTLANRRGDMRFLEDQHGRLVDLAERTGWVGLKFYHSLILASLNLRNANFAETIAICESAVSDKHMSRSIKPKFLKCQSSAFALSGNMASAQSCLLEAQRLDKELADEGALWEDTQLQARFARSIRSDAATTEERGKEIPAEETAVDGKQALGAALAKVQRILAKADGLVNKGGRVNRRPLFVALKELAKAEALVKHLEPHNRVVYQADIHQTRAQLHTYLGSDANVVAEWQKVVDLYETNKLRFEAANSRFVLGCFHSRRACQEGRSERNVNTDLRLALLYLYAALKFFNGELARLQEADALRELAHLFHRARSTPGLMNGAYIMYFDRWLSTIFERRRIFATMFAATT